MNAGKTAYSYTLGPTGNRLGAAESGGRTVNWNYDGLYRLANESIANDPNSKDGTASYGLDPVGNRLSLFASLANLHSGTFNYDANDRLSSETYR